MCRNFFFWLFQILASKIMLLIQGFHVQWPLIFFYKLSTYLVLIKKLSFTFTFILQTITVLNEGKLPRSIVVQLCDQFGNPAKVSDVRMQLTKEGKIKVTVIKTLCSHHFQKRYWKDFYSKTDIERIQS